MLIILLIIAAVGVTLLYFGGDLLIKGAVLVSNKFNISKVLVSSIIVGFGTSMPEFILSVEAVILGSSQIAVGNIVGSNIANILFITGIAAVITPFAIDKGNKDINYYMCWMLCATLLLTAVSQIQQGLFFYHGVIFLALLIFYLTQSYRHNKSSKNCEEYVVDDVKHCTTSYAVILSVVGLVLLALGSATLLYAVTAMAKIFNISQEVIGLGVVAFGSSLPEFSAAVIASLQKRSNIVIGSILGSNVFNILLTGGSIAIVDDIKISHHILTIDLWFLLIITILFCFIGLIYKTFSRLIGMSFIALYLGYMYVLFL